MATYNKYKMRVTVYDTVTTEVQISKAEYLSKINNLKAQIEEINDDEVSSDFSIINRNYKTCKETIYRFTITTTDIELIHIECNKGYCFG